MAPACPSVAQGLPHEELLFHTLALQATEVPTKPTLTQIAAIQPSSLVPLAEAGCAQLLRAPDVSHDSASGGW